MNLSIIAYTGKTSPDFIKHLEAVKFCIERGLSFPKETEVFFKGKLNGDDLSDIKRSSILGYIENGIQTYMKIEHYKDEGVAVINTKNIPAHAEEIHIKIN